MKAVKLDSGKDMVGRSLQKSEDLRFDLTHCQGFSSHNTRHEFGGNGVASVSGGEQFQDGNSSLYSTSRICPAPLPRQFWQAGSYDHMIHSRPINAHQNDTSYLRIHPKFLHSNATSHKWAFGAMAELLDNSIDEIQNGATFVIVDKISNPRNGSPALFVRDNGGGMDPEAMRRCMSFGFSDKKLKTAIGQYGNGFKTSSMRLGADVIIFTRHTSDRKLTQSVGLLSYTFLMQTQQDRIIVPMVNYMFNSQTGSWNTVQQEQQFLTNLSILLQWSPFTTEAQLLKQCDDIGPTGTKIIIYNLWHNDEGKLELNFEVDPEDICISDKSCVTTKNDSLKDLNERHLANRLRISLRAYLSVLYLRLPGNFSILLRGRVVEHHSIVNDLKFPECILYKPQNGSEVITTIGFVKEAPDVNIHGFNVYHKNRLILPFWHVVTYRYSRGRGVVGVLEANFMEPTHNKQDFEKTPVFQKLETRLKDMTHEYWDYRCGLLGYQQIKKSRAMTSRVSSDSGQSQPVMLGREFSGSVGATASIASGASQMGVSSHLPHVAAESGFTEQFLNQDSQGAHHKRKVHNNNGVEPEVLKRLSVTGSRTHNISGGNVVIEPVHQVHNQDSTHIIKENKRLRAQCQECEKGNRELDLKVARLKEKIQKAQCEFARLQIESELLERNLNRKMENPPLE